MLLHRPSRLKGPSKRARDWWSAPEDVAPPPQTTDHERPFRAALVARIRREIADGRYETPEKFEIALQRLLHQIEGG